MDNVQILDLSSALNKIKEEYLREGGKGLFFFAGAGLTTKNIKSTETIIAKCQEKTFDGLPVSDNESKDLGFWLNKAYPGLRERKIFLKGLLGNDEINPDNVILAKLLTSGFPSNLLVTTNFDNQLQNIFNLYDEKFEVLDNPVIFEDYEHKDKAQVIKLHGSYYNYMSNECPEEKSVLLEKLLKSRSILVIGFNIREDRLLLKKLKELSDKEGLQKNIYWFLQRREEIYSIPEWLRESGKVIFVGKNQKEPVLPFRFMGEELSEALNNIDMDLININQRRDLLCPGEILEALGGSLPITLPDIMENPLRHLEKRYENIRKIHNDDLTILQEDFSIEFDRENNFDSNSLNITKNMLLSYQINNALKKLNSLDTGKFSPEQKGEFAAQALYAAKRSNDVELSLTGLKKAFTLIEPLPEERSKYLTDIILWAVKIELGIENYDGVLELIDKYDSSIRCWESILLKSLALAKQKKFNEAIKTLVPLMGKDSLPGYLGEGEIPPEAAAKLCFTMAWLMNADGKTESALNLLSNMECGREEDNIREFLMVLAKVNIGEADIQQLDELVEKLEKEGGYKVLVAYLTYIKAYLTGLPGQPADTIKVLNKLQNNFADSWQREIRDIRGKALNKKAELLKIQGSFLESIRVNEIAIDDYGTDLEPEARFNSVKAYLENIDSKLKMEWKVQVLEDIEKLLENYRRDPHKGIRKELVRAEFIKADLLREAGEKEAAENAYKALLDFYKPEEDISTRKYMAKSWLDLGELQREKDSSSALKSLSKFQYDFERYKDELRMDLIKSYGMAKEIFVANERYSSLVKIADEVLAKYGVGDVTEEREIISSILLEKVLSLKELQETLKALDASKYIEAKYPEMDNENILKVIIKAHYEEILLLRALKNPHETFTACEIYLTKFEEITDKDTEKQIIDVLLQKAILLKGQGKKDEAKKELSRLLDRFKAYREEYYVEILIKAIFLMAEINGEEEAYEEELNSLDTLLGIVPQGNDRFLKYEAEAYLRKGCSYLNFQKNKEALENFAFIRTKFASSHNKDIRSLVFIAGNYEVSLLEKEEKYPELLEIGKYFIDLNAIEEEDKKNLLGIIKNMIKAEKNNENYKGVVEITGKALNYFAKETGVFYEEAVAGIYLDEIYALNILNEHDKLLNTYSNFTVSFTENKDQKLKEISIAAQNILGLSCIKNGYPEEALKIFNEVVQYFNKDTNIPGKYLAEAMYRIANIYKDSDRGKEAMTSFNNLINLGATNLDLDIKVWVYKGLLDKAELLDKKIKGLFAKSNMKKAVGLYEKLIKDLQGEDDVRFVELRIKAMLSLGKLLVEKSRIAEGRIFFTNIIRDYAQNTDPVVNKLVFAAQIELDR